MVEVRKVEAGDLFTYVDLGMAFAKEAGITISRDDAINETYGFMTNCVTVGAFDGDVMIGGLSLAVVRMAWLNIYILEERMLYIKPDYRGLGLLKKFIDFATEYAKAKQCSIFFMSPNVFGSPDPSKSAAKLKSYGFSDHGFILRKEI